MDRRLTVPVGNINHSNGFLNAKSDSDRYSGLTAGRWEKAASNVRQTINRTLLHKKAIGIGLIAAGLAMTGFTVF